MEWTIPATGWATMALPQTWLRGPATIKDGWIVLARDRATEYLLTPPAPEEASLLFDLAAIRQPAEAVAFVESYGLLWHGPESETHREEFSAWDQHARRLRLNLSLYRVLRSAESGDPESWALVRRVVANAESRRPEAFADDGPATTDEQIYERAAYVLQMFINEGLGRALARVLAVSQITGRIDSRFVLAADVPHLLGAVYHQLALLVVQHEPIEECVECGRFFILGDRRQQYCSKLCSGRARYRRWEQKHKAPAEA